MRCRHDSYHACMAQLTLRIPDELAADLRRVAASEATSVNALASDALRARVDPDAAGPGVERARERLRRAGLLAELEPRGVHRPDDAAFEAARRAAGRGRPLSELVGEGRG